MTPAELDAIEKRCEAATKGPWLALPAIRREGRCDGIVSQSVREDYNDEIPKRIVETDGGFYPPEMPDALFMAAARTDVPALVAEVRRLRAQAAELASRIRCEECRKGEHEIRGNGESCVKWRYEQANGVAPEDSE